MMMGRVDARDRFSTTAVGAEEPTLEVANLLPDRERRRNVVILKKKKLVRNVTEIQKSTGNRASIKLPGLG